jgi:hypothetical protein
MARASSKGVQRRTEEKGDLLSDACGVDNVKHRPVGNPKRKV